MKAAVCREFGKPLVVEEVALDPPHGGEVRVGIAACAICQSDVHFMDGAWGGDLPCVFGHEAAGVVEETGPGVVRIKPGDHVVVTLLRACGACYYCARGQPNICETTFPLDEVWPLKAADGSPIKQGLRTGAFAEQVVVDASQAVVIPKDMPLDSASLLACGVITGFCAVANAAAVPPDSHVVTIGTGGVGLNCVQGAALCNAKTNIAIDLSDDKLAAAKSLGASHTINPANRAARDLRETVRAWTDGRGADYVFVAVGSPSAIVQGMGLLRPGGALVVVGMPPKGVKTEIETLDLADNAQRIIGSKMGSARPQVDVPRLVELYRQGRLKLDELISNRYPLEDINAAIASSRRGEALRNVIIF